MSEPLERLLNQLLRLARDKRVLGPKHSAQERRKADLEFYPVPRESGEDSTFSLEGPCLYRRVLVAV